MPGTSDLLTLRTGTWTSPGRTAVRSNHNSTHQKHAARAERSGRSLRRPQAQPACKHGLLWFCSRGATYEPNIIKFTESQASRHSEHAHSTNDDAVFAHESIQLPPVEAAEYKLPVNRPQEAGSRAVSQRIRIQHKSTAERATCARCTHCPLGILLPASGAPANPDWYVPRVLDLTSLRPRNRGLGQLTGQ